MELISTKQELNLNKALKEGIKSSFESQFASFINKTFERTMQECVLQPYESILEDFLDLQHKEQEVVGIRFNRLSQEVNRI